MVFFSRNLWRMRAASASSPRVARASASRPSTSSGSRSRERGAARRHRACRAPCRRRARRAGRRACGSCSAPCRSTCRSRCWRRCRRSSRRRSMPDRGRSCGRSGASRRLAAAPITPGCSVIGRAVGGDLAAAPAVAEQHQHRVADRLARQARARGAERDGRAAGARSSASSATKLVFALDDDDELAAPAGRSSRRCPRRAGAADR